MGFKQLVLAILPLMIVLIQANFTDLQTEVTETKQELHNLQILVSDLRSEQKDLRQLSNDHVIVHWLKNSMMDLRREMNELAVQQERNSALDHRLENQIQQMRLDIRKPSADKVLLKVGAIDEMAIIFVGKGLKYTSLNLNQTLTGTFRWILD